MLRFVEKEGATYKYASVQFRITNAGEYFASLQALIPDEAVYHQYEPVQGANGPIEDMRDKYGRENSPHVTVLYGLDWNLSVVDIRRVLDGVALPDAVYGAGLTMFDTDSRYKVVKLDIKEPKQLWRINKVLKRLPVPGETFPEYHPHMTVAYVKKDWQLPKSMIKNSPPLKGYFEFSNNGVTVRL